MHTTPCGMPLLGNLPPHCLAQRGLPAQLIGLLHELQRSSKKRARQQLRARATSRLAPPLSPPRHARLLRLPPCSAARRSAWRALPATERLAAALQRTLLPRRRSQRRQRRHSSSPVRGATDAKNRGGGARAHAQRSGLATALCPCTAQRELNVCVLPACLPACLLRCVSVRPPACASCT